AAGAVRSRAPCDGAASSSSAARPTSPSATRSRACGGTGWVDHRAGGGVARAFRRACRLRRSSNCPPPTAKQALGLKRRSSRRSGQFARGATQDTKWLSFCPAASFRQSRRPCGGSLPCVGRFSACRALALLEDAPHFLEDSRLAGRERVRGLQVDPDEIAEPDVCRHRRHQDGEELVGHRCYATAPGGSVARRAARRASVLTPRRRGRRPCRPCSSLPSAVPPSSGSPSSRFGRGRSRRLPSPLPALGSCTAPSPTATGLAASYWP